MGQRSRADHHFDFFYCRTCGHKWILPQTTAATSKD
jgi:hypothetical protein